MKGNFPFFLCYIKYCLEMLVLYPGTSNYFNAIFLTTILGQPFWLPPAHRLAWIQGALFWRPSLQWPGGESFGHNPLGHEERIGWKLSLLDFLPSSGTRVGWVTVCNVSHDPINLFHYVSLPQDLMLRHGWRTGAIVPELETETKMVNTEQYSQALTWLQALTGLLERMQVG